MKNFIGVCVLALLISIAFYNGYKKTEAENKEEKYLSAEEYMETVTLDVGSKAPNITVVDLNTDEQVKLSDYMDKPVILTFFASWCEICKEDMPLFNDMKEKYEDEIAILAVNYTQTERSVNDVRKYQKKYDLQMPVLIDPVGKAVGKYKVISLPTTYFINKNGKIEDKSFGAFKKSQLEEKIKQLLSSNA